MQILIIIAIVASSYVAVVSFRKIRNASRRPAGDELVQLLRVERKVKYQLDHLKNNYNLNHIH